MGKISILKKVYCCFILLFGDGSELRRKHKRILMVIKCFDMQTYRYDIKINPPVRRPVTLAGAIFMPEWSGRTAPPE